MITMNHALRLIEQRRDDAVVVPTMTGNRGSNDVSGDESLDGPTSERPFEHALQPTWRARPPRR